MTNKIINRIVQIKNIILNSTSFTEKNYYLKIKYLTIKIMIIKLFTWNNDDKKQKK